MNKILLKFEPSHLLLISLLAIVAYLSLLFFLFHSASYFNELALVALCIGFYATYWLTTKTIELHLENIVDPLGMGKVPNAHPKFSQISDFSVAV